MGMETLNVGLEIFLSLLFLHFFFDFIEGYKWTQFLSFFVRIFRICILSSQSWNGLRCRPLFFVFRLHLLACSQRLNPWKVVELWMLMDTLGIVWVLSLELMLPANRIFNKTSLSLKKRIPVNTLYQLIYNIGTGLLILVMLNWS